MKTIQIKVTIDGVSYLSDVAKVSDDKIKRIANKIDDNLNNNLSIAFTDEKGNNIFFGSELVKKSIITIIEL